MARAGAAVLQHPHGLDMLPLERRQSHRARCWAQWRQRRLTRAAAVRCRRARRSLHALLRGRCPATATAAREAAARACGGLRGARRACVRTGTVRGAAARPTRQPRLPLCWSHATHAREVRHSIGIERERRAGHQAHPSQEYGRPRRPVEQRRVREASEPCERAELVHNVQANTRRHRGARARAGGLEEGMGG